MQTVNGKSHAALDIDNGEPVQARTSYEPKADEADTYASMESAPMKAKLYTELPLYERFISKSERDSADSGSFAGKGKSFPILKPTDIAAAVSSMGRAGAGNVGTSTLKSNIISIAKKKGWTKYLPKAWQDGSDTSGDSKEGLRAGTAVGDIRLVESFAFVDTIRLAEASRTDYEVKLIAPGKGSSAFYPAKVLERDGPKVFKSGTHMYWNHATDTEEAQRPEGDLSHLAAVLTSDAYYKESGKAGPGLYAKAKVFSDYAQQVEEKAPHIGLSIRASGNVEKGKLMEGRPVLKEMVFADSADFVTKAGAGGMVVLTEAARPSNLNLQEGDGEDMDNAELKKLQENQKKTNQRLALYEAKDFAAAELKTIRLPEAAKQRILDRCVGNAPLTADGTLDESALKKHIAAEAKEEGEYLAKLTGGRIVEGMGAPLPTTETDPTKLQEAYESEMKDIAGALGITDKASRKFFIHGRSAA
jgi:hypothetical protein